MRSYSDQSRDNAAFTPLSRALAGSTYLTDDPRDSTEYGRLLIVHAAPRVDV